MINMLEHQLVFRPLPHRALSPQPEGKGEGLLVDLVVLVDVKVMQPEKEPTLAVPAKESQPNVADLLGGCPGPDLLLLWIVDDLFAAPQPDAREHRVELAANLPLVDAVGARAGLTEGAG